MTDQKFTVSPIPSSVKPIQFDAKRCVAVCPSDILFPDIDHPLVMYPGECYYCSACVMVCPSPGAIKLTRPLMNQAKFIEIEK